MMVNRGYGLVLLLCIFESNNLRLVRSQEGSGNDTSIFEDCDGYPTLSNAKNFTGETTHESIINVVCNSGYTSTGAEQYNCSNGEWQVSGDGGQPYCATQCGIPTIANGQANLTNNGCSYENCTAEFQCDAGYTLSGQQQLTCAATGAWGILPSCTIVDCGAPTLPNGMYSGSTTYGSEVTLSCNSNYILAGPSSANCGPSGNWSELPTCLYNCGELENIANAASDMSCNGPQLQGCTVIITCNSGYDLTGNSTVQCLADRGWTFLPSCVPSNDRNTFDIILILRSPPLANRAAFRRNIRIALIIYYTTTMGSNFLSVIILTIQYTNNGRSKRQVTGDVVQVDYTVVTKDTEVAKGEFSKVHADLLTTESLSIDGQKEEPIETRLLGVTLTRNTSRDTTAFTDASCKIYKEAYGVCPSGTECQVSFEDNKADCVPIVKDDDDFALKVGLGVGIPLFLLTCALIGAVACFVIVAKKRRRTSRRKRRDALDHSDSASATGFSATGLPTRFNTEGRRGPVYGPYFPEVWNDAASYDSDDDPTDTYYRRERREMQPEYLVSSGYTEPRRAESNFSWDFMYPRLNENFSMPRPKI